MVPILHGARITLRGFTWADFAPFAAMWQEPEVAEFIPFAPVPLAQSWARFNSNTYRWALNGFGNWAVVDKSGVFLGTTGFFVRYLQKSERVFESGWVFAAAAQGQGFGSEAVQLAHDWFDAQAFGGHSTCMMGPDHGASIRVAEKVGYTGAVVDTDAWGPVQTMERTRPV
ncbi:MAG: GNAT family N-acetyltransferase [Paracoccaceae bacterium]